MNKNGCEYCKDDKFNRKELPVMFENDNIFFYITSSNKLSIGVLKNDMDYGYDSKDKINYCFNCGKKL